VWQLDRLMGSNPELMERASQLDKWERYRLIEVLDPSTITHYEFFLSRPPLPRADWSTDPALLAAIPELNPCIDGWPSSTVFNADYQIIRLSEADLAFLTACAENTQGRSIQEILTEMPLSIEQVRSLLDQQLLILSPGT
jgi:hypothetical protein